MLPENTFIVLNNPALRCFHFTHNNNNISVIFEFVSKLELSKVNTALLCYCFPVVFISITEIVKVYTYVAYTSI